MIEQVEKQQRHHDKMETWETIGVALIVCLLGIAGFSFLEVLFGASTRLPGKIPRRDLQRGFAQS